MIKSEWIVSNMAARNALEVASADVYAGAECMVLSTGSVFRAVRSGTGATMWAGVCTEQGTWTPTALARTAIKSADLSFSTSYSRCGDIVDGGLVIYCELEGTGPDRSIEFSLPVDPLRNLDFYQVRATGTATVAGTIVPCYVEAGETTGLVSYFTSAAADDTDVSIQILFRYRVGLDAD